MIALLAFALPFSLYIAFPSSMWNFDGVACATALELGNPVYYFHANHLVYGLLGLAFWKMLAPLGIHRALPALQLLTSLLSVLGLTVLYHVLEQEVKDRWLALGIVVTMAVSAVTWVWSIEAQVYTLGLMALCAATYVLLRPGLVHRWRWVGMLQGLAVLGHQAHVLWTIPALYWLWSHVKTPMERRDALTEYLLCLALSAGIPYLLVVSLVIVPHHPNIPWVARWLMGSAGLTNQFHWHFSGWTGPLQWLRTTGVFFWGSFWPYHAAVPAWCWILTGVSAIGFIAILGASLRKRSEPVWAFSILWLAVYGLFFMTWEPSTECYRLTDLIPVALLMSLGLLAIPGRTVRLLMVLSLAGMLLAINLTTRIQPMSQVSNNTLYQQLSELTRTTPANSVYLTAGGLSWIYLLYFHGRSAWDIHSLQRMGKPAGLDFLQRGKSSNLYIQEQALTDPWVQSWIKPSTPVPVDQLPWVQIR